MECGILVSRPGIEPLAPAVEVQSLNHWTAREVPAVLLKLTKHCKSIILQYKIKIKIKKNSPHTFANILEKKKIDSLSIKLNHMKLPMLKCF